MILPVCFAISFAWFITADICVYFSIYLCICVRQHSWHNCFEAWTRRSAALRSPSRGSVPEMATPPPAARTARRTAAGTGRGPATEERRPRRLRPHPWGRPTWPTQEISRGAGRALLAAAAAHAVTGSHGAARLGSEPAGWADHSECSSLLLLLIIVEIFCKNVK